jgi:hypothetical protein
MATGFAGLLGFFGIRSGGLKGFAGMKSAAAAMKGKGGFMRWLRNAGLTGAATKGSKIGRIANIMKAGKGGSLMTGVLGSKGMPGAGVLKGLKNIPKGLLSKGAGALGSVGKLGLRGLSGVGKFAGSMAWPLLIFTTIVDGILGWFKAGEIWKEPTVKQRIAGVAAGIIDGVVDIVRWPLNALLKALGRKERLPELFGPLAKTFNWLFEKLAPAVKHMWKGIQVGWKGLKAGINLLIDIWQFPIKFLTNPKEAIINMIGRTKDMLMFFIDDFPKHIMNGFKVTVNFLADLGDKITEGAEWLWPKIKQFMGTVWENWKKFSKEVFGFTQMVFQKTAKAMVTNIVRAVGTLVNSIIELIASNPLAERLKLSDKIRKLKLKEDLSKGVVGGSDIIKSAWQDYVKRNPNSDLAEIDRAISSARSEVTTAGKSTISDAKNFNAFAKDNTSKVKKAQANKEAVAQKDKNKGLFDGLSGLFGGRDEVNAVQQNNTSVSNDNSTVSNVQNSLQQAFNPHIMLNGTGASGFGMK